MTHLFLTATCTVSILIAFENLIGVKANQIHWPSPLNMVNRKVRIEVLYTPLWYRSVKKSIKSYLLPHPTLPNKVIIYSNARTHVLVLVEKLESYLDRQTELQTTCGVLTLVGTQNRQLNVVTIEAFINGIEGNESNLNILCATNGVGNAGIDSNEICAVRFSTLCDRCKSGTWNSRTLRWCITQGLCLSCRYLD